MKNVISVCPLIYFKNMLIYLVTVTCPCFRLFYFDLVHLPDPSMNLLYFFRNDIFHENILILFFLKTDVKRSYLPEKLIRFSNSKRPQ